MTLPELAAFALAALDAQQKYFKSRSREDLIESKRLEKELRKAAEGVLVAQPTEQPAMLACGCRTEEP